jgi:signal transduction histidine kinase
MVAVTLLVVAHDRREHHLAVERRIRTLASALAVPVTDAMMNRELGVATDPELTDTYISEILARNRDAMRYVVVADENGVVIHSNRWSLVGQRFERALGLASVADPPEASIRIDEGGERVMEVREPLYISTRFWGSLAVGFSMEPTEQELEQLKSRLAISALLLMVGNSVLMALALESMIRPILSLHQVMQRAARGDLAVRAELRRRDEVGELAESFNQMMVELGRAREQERARRAQLAHTEKMAAVGTLATGVAHEVNNPLSGMLTCIENMRRHPEDAEMRERYLALIEDGLKRVERTVAGLLDFSRTTATQLVPTPLNACLRGVVELAGYKLRQTRVAVRLELDPRDPLVTADRIRIEQLFLNLVLNALQAMPEGGSLSLRTFRRGDREVAEVQDTGTGIPESIRDRIFDPFFTTREVGAGTGLGLAVSDSIARAHDATIEVESRPEKGSIFRVSFPRADGDAP